MTFSGYFFLRGEEKILDYKITLNLRVAKKYSSKTLTSKQYVSFAFTSVKKNLFLSSPTSSFHEHNTKQRFGPKNPELSSES